MKLQAFYFFISSKINIKKLYPTQKPCIVKTPLNVKKNAHIAVEKGQGLGSIKWNEWHWRLIYIKAIKKTSTNITLNKFLNNFVANC